jgi:hypothetical protein
MNRHAETLRSLYMLAVRGRTANYDAMCDAADEIDRLTAQVEAMRAELTENAKYAAIPAL